jgi:hypothetical protein
MNRIYNTGNSDAATMFVGTEVEHTPAYGKRTLFVVGVQSVEEIQDWLDDFASFEDSSKHIEHIYFGANQSFPRLPINDTIGWHAWDSMIEPFLDRYLCTLDIDVSCVEGLAEGALVEHYNFIPMISVKLPYVQLLGYNATIKLDDKDFKASNPGVWCHSLHNLKNRRNFTDWSKYTQDQILK